MLAHVCDVDGRGLTKHERLVNDNNMIKFDDCEQDLCHFMPASAYACEQVPTYILNAEFECTLRTVVVLVPRPFQQPQLSPGEVAVSPQEVTVLASGEQHGRSCN